MYYAKVVKAFPPKVLDAGLQLKMKIEEGPLPPANLMNIWQDTYTALDCDDLITNKFTAIGVISPILFTMAKHMQEVGVKFRLEDYEEARRYLLTTINLGLEWLETNSKYNLKLQTKTPKQHQRILEFMDCTSVLLSRLP